MIARFMSFYKPGVTDRDMGSEMLAFVDIRDGAEVFFPLTLCLVHWLIRSAGDGIDDIHRASDRIIGSLRDHTRF